MKDIQATTSCATQAVWAISCPPVGEKLIVGDTKKGFQLTTPGFDGAVRFIRSHPP